MHHVYIMRTSGEFESFDVDTFEACERVYVMRLLNGTVRILPIVNISYMDMTEVE